MASQSPDVGFRRAADDDSTDVEGYLDHEEALVGDEPDQGEEHEHEDKQQETNDEQECEEDDEEKEKEDEGGEHAAVYDDSPITSLEHSPITSLEQSPITSLEHSPINSLDNSQCTSPADVEAVGLQEESPNKRRRLSHGTADVDMIRHAIFLLSELQRKMETESVYNDTL
jgi:hypothetical protein